MVQQAKVLSLVRQIDLDLWRLSRGGINGLLICIGHCVWWGGEWKLDGLGRGENEVQKIDLIDKPPTFVDNDYHLSFFIYSTNQLCDGTNLAETGRL